MMPLVNVLDDSQPAPIVQCAGKLGEPGAQAVGGSLRDPDANLRLTLHGILPAIRFFNANTEDADNWLAAERGAKFLSILAIDPRSSKPTTRLAIGEQRFGQFADFFHVERTGRAAAGIRNHTGVGIDLARLAVPQLPEVEKTLLPPKDVKIGRASCRERV